MHNRSSSFRRSQTFQPTNYSAQATVMGDPPPPKRSLSIEFPTSPDQSLFGDQMYHSTHSHHPITLINLQDPFTCSGCKERGAGKRFSCQQCDFQLHDFCALSPPALKAHPLHVQHQLWDCSCWFLVARCIWNGEVKQEPNHDDSTVRNPSALFYHLFGRQLQECTESRRTSFQITSKKVESKMRG